LGISFFLFLNLINITARVYKLQLAEVSFLSCCYSKLAGCSRDVFGKLKTNYKNVLIMFRFNLQPCMLTENEI